MPVVPGARFASLTVCLLLYAAAGAGALPIRLRVLTYNIHHGEGTDGRIDLPRIAALINQASPDLVALQEVDEGTERTGRVRQMLELERLTGMHGAFGKAMTYQGGDYGVGVLSQRPIVRVENRPFHDGVSREPRTALTVDVEMGDGEPPLRFTSTHLDDGREAEARVSQAHLLTGMVGADDPAPRILAGDMNSRTGSDVLQVLAERWTDVFVAPEPLDAEGRPRRRVDHVFVSPASAWRGVAAQVIEDRVASDHRPVLAIVEWRGAR